MMPSATPPASGRNCRTGSTAIAVDEDADDDRRYAVERVGGEPHAEASRVPAVLGCVDAAEDANRDGKHGAEDAQDQRADDGICHAAARLADRRRHVRKKPTFSADSLCDHIEQDQRQWDERAQHRDATKADEHAAEELTPTVPHQPASAAGAATSRGRGLRCRPIDQMSRREIALTISVMMNSTRPISIERMQIESSAASVNSFAMTAAIVYCGAKSDADDLRVVADHHGHGHRFAERAAEAEHDGADDARPRVEERHPNGFPSGGAERVGPLALRLRHLLQHLTRDRRRERDDHDGENHRRRQHADAERRTAEQRQLLQPGRCRRLELAHDRHQHEDAPEAVDDRRNRREQLGQEHQRLPQPRGHSSEMKIAMPERDRASQISSARIDE